MPGGIEEDGARHLGSTNKRELQKQALRLARHECPFDPGGEFRAMRNAFDVLNKI
jgi:hypothetical protein